MVLISSCPQNFGISRNAIYTPQMADQQPTRRHPKNSSFTKEIGQIDDIWDGSKVHWLHRAGGQLRTIADEPGGNKGNTSWIKDEDLIFSVKELTIKIGESKYCSQYESISSINSLSGVTSYSLAQFVYEYLQIHRPELAGHERDTQKELEQSILCGGITQSDGLVDCRIGICYIIARRWLNQLGYKWKEVQKGVFLDRNKREDLVEYRKTFLNQMKVLLPYFVKFNEDGSILFKVYLEDCRVGGSNKNPIIMITYNESSILANNGRQKV